LRIVFFGLSITSSWGNGHATNYRALARALADRGHEVVFFERDVPWYASHRDYDAPNVRLYAAVEELDADDVAGADVVIVGSYVPDGVAVAEWALDAACGTTAFYDIDTPVTLAKLESGDHEYLSPELVPRFDLYLSFTGGPILRYLEREYGARRAVAFYCLVDADAYRPQRVEPRWDLGYLGTYSADRQPTLDRLLVAAARDAPELAFCVAGPMFPEELEWPPNVERIDHLPPSEHPEFYSAQRFTLNVTRADMVRWGWSPSVRLFEAAACGVPVVSDWWEGLDRLFEVGLEILVANDRDDVLRFVRETTGEERDALARRARARVVAEHSANRRAEQLETYVREAVRT
jgi:spore maturation protein CgeB